MTALTPTRLREPVTRRESRPGWVPIDIGELWRYREMILFQALRTVKIRYKQTLLGAAWAVLQPVLTMIVFSIFFGRLAGVSSEGFPYPIFVFVALLPWQLFSFGLTESGNSLVENSQALTKIYCPRLVFPIAAVIAGVVDFLIAFAVLVGLMAYYGTAPGWGVLALPLFTLFAVVAALAIGTPLAALNVRYRDVRYTIPFLAQLLLFLTPIAYATSLVPDEWRLLYSINPMVGVVDGFRWALLGAVGPPGPAIVVSVVATLTLLILGLLLFRRLEKTFADVI